MWKQSEGTYRWELLNRVADRRGPAIFRANAKYPATGIKGGFEAARSLSGSACDASRGIGQTLGRVHPQQWEARLFQPRMFRFAHE